MLVISSNKALVKEEKKLMMCKFFAMNWNSDVDITKLAFERSQEENLIEMLMNNIPKDQLDNIHASHEVVERLISNLMYEKLKIPEKLFDFQKGDVDQSPIVNVLRSCVKAFDPIFLIVAKMISIKFEEYQLEEDYIYSWWDFIIEKTSVWIKRMKKIGWVGGYI